MSLQGYQRWVDKCNNGLRVQHLYHQLCIGSTPCGYIQPWYDIVTPQLIMCAGMRHTDYSPSRRLFQRLRKDFPSVFQVNSMPFASYPQYFWPKVPCVCAYTLLCW